MVQKGEIRLILGPMFAGKSTELIRQIKRHIISDKKVCIIKYGNDLRYSSDKVVTHDKSCIEAIAVNCLKEVEDQVINVDVIGIDEGQFFPDIVEFSERFANEGKIIIIAALDGDYKREPFGKISDLISKCEKIKKLSSICMDCKEQNGSFTFRKTNSTQIELIGGKDIYKSLCRQCYFKNKM